MGGLYLVGAYEIHKRVNRSSDGIGANSPYYGYLVGQGRTVRTRRCSTGRTTRPMRPSIRARRRPVSPAYSTAYDVADEWAMKFGGQYRFDFGLSITYLYEDMHREVPPVMEFQNERQRIGIWFALQQSFWDGRDVAAVGWAHAGATRGRSGRPAQLQPDQHRTTRPTCTPSSGGTSSTSS